MVADAVNTKLFITINVSTFLPARPTLPTTSGDSLTATPDVRGASASPEGSVEADVAAEYVAGARRPSVCHTIVRSVAEIFCSRWRQRRIDVVTADRGASGRRRGRRGATSL